MATRQRNLDQRLPATMNDREFKRFSAIVYENAGIKLPPAKKIMLEARLQKRLKALGIGSFEEYGDYVCSSVGHDNEMVHMIDVVTTNKTDFFREPAHFEFLVKTAIPTILKTTKGAGRNQLRIWSAGCSSGEEPYTLAMVLAEYALINPDFTFSILASDICTEILHMAKTAIYPEERADIIAMNLKKKYLLKSKNRELGLVRICPQLRSMVKFRRINFMDNSFGINEKMDIIFCRNVVIYFDKQTQQNLMKKFYDQLKPGGYLFIGHSETLSGLDVKFNSVASTVYRKE